MPARLADDYHTKEIEPRLKHLKVREIANAIEVSLAYAGLVRAGKRRPHPRHWMVLARLAGAAE
jgi:hypothetical protein